MAVPRYFSGESARRMDNIRGTRRTQAVRQVGRVIGSGAVGATQGAVAGSEWLAAHPVHTYDRDRQRFYEALAAATPQMQMALQRENQILNRYLQRQVQALQAARDVMAQKAAAARTNAQVSLSQQARIAEYENAKGARDLERIDQGSPEAIRLREQLLIDQGMDPETAAREARRGVSSTGRITEADIKYAVSRISPESVFGGRLTSDNVAALQAAIRSGALAISQPGDADPIANAGGVNAIAGIVAKYGSNMSEAEQVDLVSGMTNTSASAARSALNSAASYSAAFTTSDVSELPPAVSTRVNRAARGLLLAERGSAGAGTGTGAGAGPGGSGLLSQSDMDARYMGMTSEEFVAATSARPPLLGALPPAEAQRLTELRASQYQRAVEAVAPLMERVTSVDATGHQNLADTINQIQQVAQAMNVNPEELWSLSRQGSPLAAVRGLTWLQALQQSNETNAGLIERALERPIEVMQNVSKAYVQDEEVLAFAQDMLDGQETFFKDAGRAAAEVRTAAGVPEAQSGAGERTDLTEDQAAALAAQAEADAQQEAEDEAFRQEGYTTVFGLEVPVSELPDETDLGARVMYAWDLAEQYPAHPPLQQLIQDQMNTPEFKEWMDSRGYTGNPTPDLFREFQREYQQVYRMKNIFNRRQRRLNRAAQERLGMAPDEVREAYGDRVTELGEDVAGSRRGKRRYRRTTGRETREAIRDIRDEDRDRRGKKPTLATRIRERQRSDRTTPQAAGAPREAQRPLLSRRQQQPAQRVRPSLPEVDEDDLTRQ